MNSRNECTTPEGTADGGAIRGGDSRGPEPSGAAGLAPEGAAHRQPDLQRLREAIESVDRELLGVLRRRMELVEEVAQAKLAAAFPFRDGRREEQVLQRVRGLAVEWGLDAHAIEQLYRLLMEMSISHQQAHIQGLATVPLRVAYQGVEGSYSHRAAQDRYAGRDGGVLLSGHNSFERAAGAVLSGAADLALLPIENSTAGSINETYDLLAQGRLVINAEVVHRVEHCLLALPGSQVEQLRTILSHPQALRQCENFLRTLPRVQVEAEFDTAGAARKVLEGGDPAVAAIASEEAGQMLGLEVLERGIQTQSGNFTRFVEVALEAAPAPADRPCKTSLLFSLNHKPAQLGEVLTCFGRRGLQLAKIESRPQPQAPWSYRFYLDVEDHAASASMQEALAEIGELVAELRVLGTYPRAAEDSAS